MTGCGSLTDEAEEAFSFATFGKAEIGKEKVFIEPRTIGEEITVALLLLLLLLLLFVGALPPNAVNPA